MFNVMETLLKAQVSKTYRNPSEPLHSQRPAVFCRSNMVCGLLHLAGHGRPLLMACNPPLNSIPCRRPRRRTRTAVTTMSPSSCSSRSVTDGWGSQHSSVVPSRNAAAGTTPPPPHTLALPLPSPPPRDPSVCDMELQWGLRGCMAALEVWLVDEVLGCPFQPLHPGRGCPGYRSQRSPRHT